MPSTLNLDLADPEVAEVVSQWREGGRYFITLEVVQGPTEGTMVSFPVDDITDYGPSTPEVEEEAAPGPKKQPDPAMTAMLGQKKRPSDFPI